MHAESSSTALTLGARNGRRAWALLAAALMLGAGVTGLINVLLNWSAALTGGQWAMSAAQLGYALGTLPVLVLRWRAHPALVDAYWAWGAAVVLTALLAPVVWAGSSWWVGLVAGVGAALAVLLVGAMLIGSFKPLLARG